MDVFNEKINVIKMKKIIDNFDYLYENGYICNLDKDCNNGKTKQQMKTIFDTFYDNHKKGSSNISYKFQGRLKSGRRFSTSPSLQSIPKRTRHTIASGIYRDLDMVNAHPTILNHLAKLYNIRCDLLQRYVDDRQGVFNELSDIPKDEVKTEILTIMNGGRPKLMTTFIQEFSIEMQNLRDVIVKKNPVLKKRAERSNPDNISGSTVNYLLCEWENNILTIMCEFLQGIDVEIGALVFDGIMIKISREIEIELVCASLRNVIYKRTGIYMNIVEKNMDSGYDEVLDSFEVIQDEDVLTKVEYDLDVLNGKISSWIDGTHRSIADLFISLYGSEYKITDVNGSGYKWDDNSKLWVKVETSLFVDINRLDDYINQCMSSLVELSKNVNLPTSSTEKVKENYKLISRIQKSIKMVGFSKSVWEVVYNTIYDRSFIDVVNKNKFEIPYKGGLIMDLKTGIIRCRSKDDFWSFEINYEYIDDISIAEDYINTLFDSEDMRLFIKVLLGYLITGEVCERKGFFFVGSGRNGKSEFINILDRIFKKFTSTLSKAVIIKSQSNFSDNSKPNPELAPLRSCRMGFTCELEEEEKIDENKFKNITGSDSLYYRPMYMKGDPIEFKTQTKLICITNNIPEFSTDRAMRDRVCIIPFNKRFEGSQIERDFVDSLKSEGFLTSFFSMCIKYSIDYFKNGIIYPQPVLLYTESIFRDRDVFGQFMDEMCVIESNVEISANILYDRYCDFLSTSNKKTESREVLYKKLKAIGIEKSRVTRDGNKIFIVSGLRLK